VGIWGCPQPLKSPALFSGGKALAQLWLFFVAPILGAVISALVWKFGFDKEQEG